MCNNTRCSWCQVSSNWLCWNIHEFTEDESDLGFPREYVSVNDDLFEATVVLYMMSASKTYRGFITHLINLMSRLCLYSTEYSEPSCVQGIPFALRRSTILVRDFHSSRLARSTDQSEGEACMETCDSVNASREREGIMVCMMWNAESCPSVRGGVKFLCRQSCPL